MTVRLDPVRVGDLALRLGGELRAVNEDDVSHALVNALAPVEEAGAGELAPLLAAHFATAARDAHARGAKLLVEASLAAHPAIAHVPCWVHPHAAWALAGVLDLAIDGPCVSIGHNVEIGAGCVIGAPGFGWASGPHGERRRIPQLGGVVLEDDVSIGPLCTVDSGTLAPTRIRRGVKIDAHCHIGHNCEVGEGTIIAAQSGLAGSVRVGRGVLMGGQVGVADHVVIGDRARIAAKSGVIGDVPRGATVAGYPAIARVRWLRGLAQIYRR